MANTSSIRGVLIILVTVALSLWLGIGLITDQMQTLIQVGAVGTLVLCLLMGPRIWMLVPIFGSLSIPLIRGFGTGELGKALFVTFAVLMLCIRRLPAEWRWTRLDWWALAVAALVVQVYLRNPVGLNMFGASAVGGKPYFLVALAFVTMVFYGMLVVRPKEIKWLMWASIVAQFIGTPLGYLRGGIGGSAEVSVDSRAGVATDTGGAGRVGVLNGPATTAARIVCAYISPLKAIFRPLWMLLVLFAVGAAAYTGYRNTVAMVGLIMLAGIGYHGGVRSMWLASFLGAIGIAVLAGINYVAPLPANMQRALSPFPGTWEERYTEQAERSTDWRVEMWEAALFTDEWIDNKILGDGLGMSRIEFQRSLEADARGPGHDASGLTTHQINALTDGNYHSGPVQTIRTVGYVGLIVLMAAMIAVARSAHQLIHRCRGTEYFPVALFFGIPMVIKPIFFTFVFGTFDNATAGLFMSIATLKLFHANLPVPEWVPRSKQPYMPLVVRREPSRA